MTVGRARAWIAGAVALIAVVAIVVLTVPDAGSRAPSTPAPSMSGAASTSSVAAEADGHAKASAVRALLERRARAVAERDEAAFLATVDPHADPRFREAQRALFANLANVPLASWRYRLDARQAVDTSEVPSTGAERLWAPRVDLEYALAGVDREPTSRQLGYLFAQRAGRWYLTSDTAMEHRGRTTWRGPWDFGPCVALRTGTGLVLAHPAREAMARRLAQELDPAVRAVTAVWGRDWSRRVALWLPDSERETRAVVGPKFRTDGIVAVAVADRVDRATRDVRGQRVVFSPGGAEQLSTDSLRVVLRHEITHIAARPDTVDGAPMWLLEGFADYVGYRGLDVPMAHAAPVLASSVRLHGAPNSLPSDADFTTSGATLDLAYQRSWSLSRYIAERFGEPGLLRLYRRLAALGPTGESTMDSVVREVLGVDRAALVTGWRTYLLNVFR